MIPLAGSTAFRAGDFFSMFRQNVLEGMLADPAYGGNKDMVGWKWIGFPGDPMRRGDVYYKYIFKPSKVPVREQAAADEGGADRGSTARRRRRSRRRASSRQKKGGK